MKYIIVALLVGAIGVCSGFTLRGHIDAESNRWLEIYDRGFKAGEEEGFKKGWAQSWDELGMHWIGSYSRFIGFVKEYGSIHNTLWSKFTIEEKVTIAMYGGSGSKLELEEIEEWSKKYGR